MNEIKIFNYESKEVRSVLIDDITFWIVKDVCNILDLGNVGQVTSRIDDEDLSSFKVMSGGQMREMSIVNESGLYALILLSRKEEAKKFKKWITSEVLPSIRKTGQYGVKAPTTLIEALKLALEQAEQIEEMKPKALEHDRFISADNLMDVGEVAKKFGIGRNTFFKMLRDNKILMKDNEPYQEYMKYFESKIKPVPMGNKIENKSVTSFKASGISYIAKRFKLTEALK